MIKLGAVMSAFEQRLEAEFWMFHFLKTTHLPHSRMLLHYNPSSTTPALSVVASGQKPVIEQWKEHLVRLQEHGDAVVFGYGEFQGKGCVLLQLDDSVA